MLLSFDEDGGGHHAGHAGPDDGGVAAAGQGAITRVDERLQPGREEPEKLCGNKRPSSQFAVDRRAQVPLRLIVDVHAEPVPLVPTRNPATAGAPLDMTYAILRAVSPIHIEYLKNMGVGASMSIAILKQGTLWGLIASGLVVLGEPRTYDYDKVLFYPVGLWGCWRYIDRPTARSIVVVAAIVVLGGLCRYDTAVYLTATPERARAQPA